MTAATYRPTTTAEARFSSPADGAVLDESSLHNGAGKAGLPATPHLEISALRLDSPAGDSSSAAETRAAQPREGLMKRAIKRMLEDQGSLYAAPFKPGNIKWDLGVLGGTGAFLATDRRIERQLPSGHFRLYQNTSDIAIGSLSAALAGAWIYGIKTDNPHERELGELELETLTNTFLIYTPMQLLAGRQRPKEGNGKGDFWQHHSVNTSFPAGHAMFTWAMATVAAKEYPKAWVQILAYGTALAVSGSRFMARDHWASDTFVGSALGIAIGTHIFHTRCDPGLSTSCHSHGWRKALP